MRRDPWRNMESYATASNSGQDPRLSNTPRHGRLSSAQSQEATRHFPRLPQSVPHRSFQMGHVVRSHGCKASRPASSNLPLQASPLKLHCGFRHAPDWSHDWIEEQLEGQGSGPRANARAARSTSAIPPPSCAAVQFSTRRLASLPIDSTAS
eukprot:2764085-Rhodomonas_salina.1